MIAKILSKTFIVLGIMVMGISSFAATNIANQTLTFTNGIGAELTFSGAAINFGTITPNVAITQANAASISGSSNATWSVTLSGTDFTNSNKSISIPISRLSVRKAPTDTLTPVSNAGIALVAGHAAGTDTYNVDYTLKTTLTDNASAGLSSNLTYTISAQ